MGVYYMRHFIHGTKVACSDAEVKYDESLGWTQYDPAPTPVDVPSSETDAPTAKRPMLRKSKE